MHSVAIFDLDGTIIDSRAAMETAFREAYASVVGPGEPPLMEFFGLLGESFPNILEALGLPLAMWEPFRAASRARIAQVSLHDEVVTTCRKLHDNDVAVAILTGKDRERTLELLEHLSVLSIFDFIVTSSDGFPTKPSPSGVNFICDAFHILPDRAVVVGDSGFDILAAQRAGAWSIGCCWGMGTAAELQEAGADQLIDTPDLLSGALEVWRTRIARCNAQ